MFAGKVEVVETEAEGEEEEGEAEAAWEEDVEGVVQIWEDEEEDLHHQWGGNLLQEVFTEMTSGMIYTTEKEKNVWGDLCPESWNMRGGTWMRPIGMWQFSNVNGIVYTAHETY